MLFEYLCIYSYSVNGIRIKRGLSIARCSENSISKKSLGFIVNGYMSKVRKTTTRSYIPKDYGMTFLCILSVFTLLEVVIGGRNLDPNESIGVGTEITEFILIG